MLHDLGTSNAWERGRGPMGGLTLVEGIEAEAFFDEAVEEGELAEGCDV